MTMQVIDSAARFKSKKGEPDAVDWLERMEESGISHAVAAPPDDFVVIYNEEGNRQMAKWADKFPGKLSALAVANPWYGAKAVDILQKGFDCRLAGLYLHPARQGFRLTEKIVDPLIEVCIERGKPVYSSTGTPVCAMPFQLAELARRFPEARFVMGHFAYTDFAGYDVIPAAKQAPNIYLDTSCVPGSAVRQAVEEIGAERIIFGSGYPRSMPRLEVDKIRSLELDSNNLYKIMCGNASSLWGITL